MSGARTASARPLGHEQSEEESGFHDLFHGPSNGASVVRVTRKNWFVGAAGKLVVPLFSMAATLVTFVVQELRLPVDSTRYVPPSVALQTSVTTLLLTTGADKRKVALEPPMKLVMTTWVMLPFMTRPPVYVAIPVATDGIREGGRAVRVDGNEVGVSAAGKFRRHTLASVWFVEVVINSLLVVRAAGAGLDHVAEEIEVLRIPADGEAR